MKLPCEYEKILESCILFSGLSQAQIQNRLALMSARIQNCEKGEFLHLPSSPFHTFGLVLRGGVCVCCDSMDGDRIIMAQVVPGQTFGESLCFLNVSDSPVYIFALQDTAVLHLSADRLFSGGADEFTSDAEKRFASLLASRTLSMNTRIQILSKVTIRQKLMFYFSTLCSCPDTEFTVTMNREDLAAYIGANRAALCRELSAMKKEGILDYHKNVFVLKKKKGEINVADATDV